MSTGPRSLDGEVLGVRETAAFLGGSEDTVRARAARGLLPYKRWGGRLIFRRSELLAFFDALEGVSVAEALENVEGRRD